MTTPDFASFYKAAHGNPPFPWQESLAERVLRGEWPQIDVPTGCGKTSVIDIAVFALAAQADLPAMERSPLRIFFVVDRRLVVDDVYRHATELATKIETGEADSLCWARKRLLEFGGARPLEVAVMRGGMYRSNTWADLPNQPLLCVSTVDQVGSRLLFRGYGVSDSSRPIQAALVGSDSLLIIDEAHLSQPFIGTVKAVAGYQGENWREVACSRAIRSVEMSATRRKNGEASLELTEADYASDTLRPRLESSKTAELKEVSNLAEAAADEARRIPGAGVFGIVLNTVAAARETFEQLRRKEKGCILLTGRIRPFDRDRLLQQHLEQIRTGATRNEGERFFVVATQTIEVGADLDFDFLITEAAPLDSLRQRFGRLNRIGRNPSAGGLILKAKRARAGVYDESLQKTWDWLLRHATDMKVDFGVRAMGELFAREGSEDLLPKRLRAPLLFPAHLDAWAQTSPRPAVDPDIAPFLHGRDNETADVQIVWRGDLEGKAREDASGWGLLLEAAPPLSTEALAVPFFAAKRWLQGFETAFADVEGIADMAEQENGEDATRPFLIWRGPEPGKSSPELADLRPGDTVVVRSSEGGCDEFGWNPDYAAPVRDMGDLCANERARVSGGKYRIRIHFGVLRGMEDEVRAALEAVEDEQPIPKELCAAFQAASGSKHWGKVRAYGRQGSGLLVESKWFPAESLRPEKPVEEDEAEDADTSSLTTEVTLRAHTAAVTQEARAFAARCGVHGGPSQAIEMAAQLHDLGKLDARFQYILSPSKPPEPLAKSGSISRAEYLRRRDTSGLPRGARHEFASVGFAEQLSAWPDGCDEQLAFHLIGAHHGYGRPFPPVWDDTGYTIAAQIGGRPLAVYEAHAAGRLGSGWAERYAMLTRKYGWWGLAFLEALLRRADCVVSRREVASRTEEEGEE